MIIACRWVSPVHVKLSKLSALLLNGLLNRSLKSTISFVSPTYNQCQYNLERFISLCHHICVPIVPDKTFRPSTTLTFAGIELDSIQSEARLPQEKVTKCIELITAFLTHKKVQLHKLQSLIGLLSFATTVVTPGTTFLRHLYDLTQGVLHPHHFIQLRSEVKNDLRVWLGFLSSFNGVYFFRNEVWENSIKLNLFTDAAGAIGFGAIFGYD